MNKQEKKKFIKEYCKALQSSILADVSKMPDEWDGIELRWLIDMRTKSDTSLTKRLANFNNDILIHNL